MDFLLYMTGEASLIHMGIVHEVKSYWMDFDLQQLSLVLQIFPHLLPTPNLCATKTNLVSHWHTVCSGLWE